MANTAGFEVVAQITPGVLTEVVRAAWDSGGGSTPGTIPHSFDIASGTNVDGFIVADGQAQIPREGLGVAMAPDVNGIDLKIGLDIQLKIDSPPVPSASMFTLGADVHARIPVGQTGTEIDVGLLFGSLTPSNVTATLTSPLPDPVTPNLDAWIAEFVHKMYADGEIPPLIQQTNFTVGPLGAYTVDATADIYDDDSNPARRIEVSRPVATQLRVSLPVHLRIYDIQKNIVFAPTLKDPMGITARIVIVAPLTVDMTNGSVAADFSAPTVTVENIQPAGPEYGIEGGNYTDNKVLANTFGFDLEAELRSNLIAQATALAQDLGAPSFGFPTRAGIESAIAALAFSELQSQGAVSVWTPDTSGGVSVSDVQVKALADVLAIALNAGGGANANNLTSFVPGGSGFAIAIAAGKVLALIDESIHRPESEGGFGPDFPPKRFNADGHDVDLTRLDISLTNAIHMDGDVTVIDAILGSIDVDASFTVDVGLTWVDNSDGTQRLDDVPGEPDVSLGLLAWILSLLLGFITFGVIGVIIAVVVMKVVESTAESVGGAVVRDSANQVTGVGAWPSNLRGIGVVDSKFENPVDIAPDGLLFRG